MGSKRSEQKIQEGEVATQYRYKTGVLQKWEVGGGGEIIQTNQKKYCVHFQAEGIAAFGRWKNCEQRVKRKKCEKTKAFLLRCTLSLRIASIERHERHTTQPSNLDRCTANSSERLQHDILVLRFRRLHTWMCVELYGRFGAWDAEAEFLETLREELDSATTV